MPGLVSTPGGGRSTATAVAVRVGDEGRTGEVGERLMREAVPGERGWLARAGRGGGMPEGEGARRGRGGGTACLDEEADEKDDDVSSSACEWSVARGGGCEMWW